MNILDYLSGTKAKAEPSALRSALCSVEGCERRLHAQGLCGTHYARVYRGDDLHAPLRKPPRKLTAEQIAIARSSRLSHAVLAEAYNVAPSTIYNARNKQQTEMR